MLQEILTKFPVISNYLRFIKLGLWLAAVLSVFYAGWYLHGRVYEAGQIKALLEQVKTQQRQIEFANMKSQEYEKQLAAQKEQTTQLLEDLKNELKKPDYRCQLPINGLRLYRQALAAR